MADFAVAPRFVSATKRKSTVQRFFLLSYRASPSLERWLIPYVLYLSIACAQSELSKFFLR
jgi:hypothetical protein